MRNRKPKPKSDDAFDAAAAGFGAVGVSHSENARYASRSLSAGLKIKLTRAGMGTAGATRTSAGRSFDEIQNVFVFAGGWAGGCEDKMHCVHTAGLVVASKSTRSEFPSDTE